MSNLSFLNLLQLELFTICAKKGDRIILNTYVSEWTVSNWINSKPLTLKELHSHVVLVRWWTGPTYPYCINSAVTLNEYYERYKNEGLLVLGFYHHKSKGSIDKNIIKEYTESLGFKFPVAIDHGWKTLTTWWLKLIVGNRRLYHLY